MVEVESYELNAIVRTKPFVVVGIPAFNEEQTIDSVIIEARNYADAIIVCDDGSSDATAAIAEQLGALTIRHDRNKGKGWALKSIFEACKKYDPDIIVTLDADGQHDPREIPMLIKPIVDGQTDISIGSRYLVPSVQRIPRYRKFGLHLINWLNRKAVNSDVRDSQNGFRAYSPKALRVVASSMSHGYSVESEQIVLAKKDGLKIKEVSVTTKYDGLYKTSKKSPLMHGMGLVGYLLKVMVEERPLLFLGVPGFLSIIVGLFFAAWMFGVFSVDHYIATNLALASIAFSIIGILSVFASITLYSISRVSEKIIQKVT
jgi:glycosyltransferase involved in cell wall biosynthesis